jgi:hypothetical protein
MLVAVGAWDCFQRRHTILRNYPLRGHLRWFFEFLRPYLRKYIVEDDLGGRPFSHNARDLVYARAKNDVDVLAFGAKLDGFYHDTGEGGVGRYHLNHDGYLV